MRRYTQNVLTNKKRQKTKFTNQLTACSILELIDFSSTISQTKTKLLSSSTENSHAVRKKKWTIKYPTSEDKKENIVIEN